VSEWPIMTFDGAGKPLTETIDDVTMPADYSFASVNDYVHGLDVNFENLVALCLGMANEIDTLAADRGAAVGAAIDLSHRIEELEAEITHWKANHDNQVERARILMERSDLTIERCRAYEQWGKDKAELASVKNSERVAALDKSVNEEKMADEFAIPQCQAEDHMRECIAHLCWHGKAFSNETDDGYIVINLSAEGGV